MSELSSPMVSSSEDTQHKIAPLHLCSTIDAAEINRLDEALKASFYKRLLAERHRRIVRIGNFYKHRVTVVRWLSVAGLVVAMLLAVDGGLPYRGYRLELPFAVFFICVFAVSFSCRATSQNPNLGRHSGGPWRKFMRPVC